MFKNILKGLGAAALLCALSSCEDFFETIPGTQYDMESTFQNRTRTEEFLNNVYSYVPEESRERWPNTQGNCSGIWTASSIEGDVTWDWHITNEWNTGSVYPSNGWINFWYIEYYRGISKASTFIANVDNCLEATEQARREWKAQARALRAFYYFMLLRSYGPTTLLGEEAVPLDTPLEDLLLPRNSVDEIVNFIVTEFDRAAEDLPSKYTQANLGRFDRGACKAFKAKVLLYAASPLFNCNETYAGVTNSDGKQIFPQDKSQETAKWEAAKQAYEEFFTEFVPSSYDLYRYTDPATGLYDAYESCRRASCGYYFSDSPEQIFVRMANDGDAGWIFTPYNATQQGSGINGGMGFGTSQEMVDLFFTEKGLRIVDDPDYQAVAYGIGEVPDASKYGWDSDYNNPADPDRQYFASNTNLTLKEWANREPRFYVNITFNGSTWLNDQDAQFGKFTTNLTRNGQNGYTAAGHDVPYSAYGIRKRAWHAGNQEIHAATLLRLADMYLGYAECCSAVGDYETAIDYVNLIRNRAGIPEYGSGQDSNGNNRIALSDIGLSTNRTDVDKVIRRERLVELAFEWNHFFDVRRWKVADMAVGDDWIYPSYHTGGEGGELHGLNYMADPPEFFQKVVFDTRVFGPQHYLFPIPDAEIRRNPEMVQNYGWSSASAE